MVPAPRAEGDPPLFAFGAELCDTRILGPERALPGAAGAGRTEEAALTACLGEAAERYAAALYDPAELRFGDAPEGAIDPRELVPFSDEQRSRRSFPYARTGPLRWVCGTDLATGRDRWAPAFAVFLPYTPMTGEAIPGPTFSTGLAAGPTIEAAREAALLEAIERDAFTIAWFAGEARPRRGDGVDLTGNLDVPVAGCLIERDVISVGTAASRTFEAAAEKARLEAELGQIYVRGLVRRSPPPERIEDFAGHARFYTDHADRRGALDVLRGMPAAAPAPAAEVNPAEALLSAGFRPWWRDLTPRDLARIGVRVVRVLVPGLTPLHADEAWPFLGAPRLREIRNRNPHPIP